MSELGEILGGGISNQQRMQSSLVKPSSSPSRFIVSDYKLRCVSDSLLVERKLVGTTFLLNTATNGILGTNTLGGAVGTYTTYESQVNQQLLPTDGREIIRDWVASSAGNPDNFHVGVGTVTFSVDDSALGSQTADVGSSDFESNTGTSSYCTVIYEIYPGLVSGTVNEFGWFTDADKMFSRRVLSTSVDPNAGYWYKFSETFKFEDRSAGDSKIVDSGLNMARDWLGGESTDRPTHSGWGMNTATVNSSDTVWVGDELDRNSIDRYTASDFKVSMSSVLGSSEPVDNNGTILSASIRRIGLLSGAIGGGAYTLDYCNSTNGWSKSADSGSPTSDSDDYKEGNSSLALSKTGTSGTLASYYKTLGSSFNASSGTYLCSWFYVNNVNDLDSSNAMEVRIGSDDSNYYCKSYSDSGLSDGWNLTNEDISSLSAVGSPDITALDYLYVAFKTTNAGTTISSGNIMMDFWHMINPGSAKLFASTKTANIEKNSNFKVSNVDTLEVL